MNKYILLITMLLLPTYSVADTGATGSTLLEGCNKYEAFLGNNTKAQKKEFYTTATKLDFLDAGYCRGAIDSYLFTNLLLEMRAEKSLGVKSITPYCAPETYDMNQMIKIVIKYLNSHPETLHLPATILIDEAIINAFPCKE